MKLFGLGYRAVGNKPPKTETAEQTRMDFTFSPPPKPCKRLIIRAVADRFRVSDQVAHEWLSETFGGEQ